MEEKKSGFLTVFFISIYAIVLIAILILALTLTGVIKLGNILSNPKLNPTVKSSLPTQVLPVYPNDPHVSDIRMIYVFSGIVGKTQQIAGGYNVTFTGGSNQYFMPGDQQVSVIAGGKQTSILPKDVKTGDNVTFTSVYNLKSGQWTKRFTVEDIKLLQGSR